MRTHDTIGSKVTHTVYIIILVGTHHTLVHQIPEESAGTARIRHHHVPVILQSCSMSAVIQTMQELGRHEDFLLSHILLGLAIRAVMLGFKAVAVSPRIEYHAFLLIPESEVWLKSVVETTLVTVAPKDDARMILITGNHLLHQLLAHDGRMCPVPSAQLTFDIETERIASLQELRIGRIMTQSHGIHVHALDEFHILYILRLAQRSTGLRTEAVTVHAFEDNFLTIDINAIAGTVFDGAEAELLTFSVERLACCILECEDGSIEMRSLGSPLLRCFCLEVDMRLIAVSGISHVRCHHLSFLIQNLSLHLRTLDSTVQVAICHKMTITLGINRHTVDVLSRFCHDKYRTEDATEVPVVSTALRHVHLTVAAFLAHLHFESVLMFSEEDAVAHIISKAIETALMQAVSRLSTVDGHLGISHHGFEDEFYLFALPLLWQRKLIFIFSFFVSNTFRSSLSVESHAILIGTESLQFPAGRHTNLGPLAGISTTCAVEVPVHHIITSMSREVLALCINTSLCGSSHRHRPQSYY